MHSDPSALTVVTLVIICIVCNLCHWWFQYRKPKQLCGTAKSPNIHALYLGDNLPPKEPPPGVELGKCFGQPSGLSSHIETPNTAARGLPGDVLTVLTYVPMAW